MAATLVHCKLTPGPAGGQARSPDAEAVGPCRDILWRKGRDAAARLPVEKDRSVGEGIVVQMWGP